VTNPTQGRRGRYSVSEGDGVPFVVLDAERISPVIAECGERADAVMIENALSFLCPSPHTRPRPVTPDPGAPSSRRYIDD
jgi:hypothetical protein